MASAGLARPVTLGTLALMMAFSSIATDLYLPAIPEMARALKADPRIIEASVATFLAGFVLGQLFWGPASDAKGRKGPVLFGIVLFMIGSAGCALAGSGEAVLAWRAVQGFGGSAAVVIARAIVSDIYDEDAAARVLSSLIAVMAIAPLAGPLVGAQILEFSGWRAIFWVLCSFSAVAFALAFFLPETNPSDIRSRGILAGLASYRAVARIGPLLRYTMVGSCFYGGLFAFITAAPVVFIDGYGFSPSFFAALLAFGTALIIVANVINVKLIATMGYAKALRLGAAIAGAGSAGVLFVAVVIPESVGLLIAAIMVYMAMAGLIVANALTGAMKSVEARSGTASAFAGAMNFAGGGLGAIVVALAGSCGVVGLAGSLAAFGLLTWLTSQRIDRARN